MDEHGHKIAGLPPVAWLGLGGLVLLFVYAHRQAGPVVSGVALPASTNADLQQSQSQAAALQVGQQQEALASRTAQDLFNQRAAQQGLANSQTAFNTQLFGVQQQQAQQGQANALALTAAAQNQALRVTQGQEQNALLQKQVDAQQIANSGAKAKSKQSSAGGWIGTAVNVVKDIFSFL